MTDDERTPAPAADDQAVESGAPVGATAAGTGAGDTRGKHRADPDEGTADGGPADDGEDAPRKKGSFARELPVLLLIAFGLALVIKAFLVQAFFIPSGSMETTLHGCTGCTGDRVLVNKLIYDFREPERGEIIVFDGAGSFQAVVTTPPAGTVERVQRSVTSFLGLSSDGGDDFIKRVIGLPGDTVVCCTDGKVSVTPAGSDTPVVLEEPYVFEDSPLSGTPCAGREFGPIVVPEGRLWVMGDHRSESADSRCHIGENGNGTVPLDKVVGKAFVVVYPLDRIKLLPTPDTFDEAGLQASGAREVPVPSALAPYGLGLVAVAPVAGLRARRRRRG